MAKKVKEEYVELTGIFGDSDDYHVYHMTKIDYFVAYAIGFALGVIVVYVFFRAILFSVIVGTVCAVKAPPIYRDYKKNTRLKNLRLQFKDLLESLTASYSTGRNTMGAFQDSYEDLKSIYGDESDIVKEIKTICAGLRNNFNIEQLLLDFSARSGLDDVESFANVFEVCNRQGSDLKKIVSDTRDIINDKIEIEMEINTMLAGNKNELHIMMAMPLIIVLSLNSMGTGTVVANTPLNVIIKMGCIGLFALAYVIGRKIVNIKI